MERYNKETVILETDKGTAHTKDQLKEVWKMRLKEFPHYKVKKIIFEKDNGKEKIIE